MRRMVEKAEQDKNALADKQIQKEMDVNLRLCSPPDEKRKPKKSRRPSPVEPSSEPPTASCPQGNRMP
ncbi:hypothetical protein CRUP_020596, partial [Coryphaenoides rupestris]